jgi:pyruvate formate lyase activating enzyme
MITRREILKCGAALAGGVVALPCFASVGKASLRPARYWHSMGDAVGCDLCPLGCNLDEGKTGFCRTRRNLNGALVTEAYANPCAVHVDPIEKKPLFHVLPGSRSFSLAVAGCNLRCLNCQNYEISQVTPHETKTTYLPPEKVVEEAKSQECATIAYTYSEPIAWFEYMLDTSAVARLAGLKNLWISNGYISDTPLRELAAVMDAANINLKTFNNELSQKLNGAKLQPVLDTLIAAKKYGIWLEVTNLIIPGWTDDPKMIRAMCAWIKQNLGADVPLHFSRFFPLYKLANLYPTPTDVLVAAKRIAHEEGIEFVYIGNVAEVDSNTYCSSCKKPLIVRDGFIIKTDAIKNGLCSFCKKPIKGIWA